jgi:lipoteichoic acid synthase
MSLRLGPLLVCLCVGLYRAVWLSMQLSGLHPFEVGYLLLSDLPVIGALGLLAFAEGLARFWKAVPMVLALVLMATYLVDVLAVLTLNSRLQLSDIPRFGVEWWAAKSFVSAWALAASAFALGSVFVVLRVPVQIARFLPGFALVLVLFPLTQSARVIPTHLQKYVGSVLFLPTELRGSSRLPAPEYRPADIAVFRRDYEGLFETPIARSGKNIILVIVESLSAADSERTSGIRDLLPQFDALSREGMLFRNFFANYEASEGGIVSLLSGVPPVHFPTASTNTFGEYALQRSVTEELSRQGYACEFLTTVPLQFISMNAYVMSPRVGFSQAGGQREIARFRDAPRFAFESPADHVLYEELLARLDSRPPDSRQPVFLTAVTASSHAPYIDPRGQMNLERNVWAYVEDELWWLYNELDRRRFFENGLLIVTSDHRKMRPIRQAERDRFGDSAKARVPLVLIGRGVPKDTLDDRLFQQSDLLRMLDRAVQPGATLSPFVLWVERYLFGLGIASNAANLEVFFSSNQAREGFRLKLHGAEIEWLKPPPDPLPIERAIHRQRAIQQATRAGSISSTALKFGRDLQPSGTAHGMLLGFSTDVDLSRDPDDPRGSLKALTTGSLELEHVLSVAGGHDGPYTLTARAFLPIPADGAYWFSLFADDEGCLAIDKQVVLGCQRGVNQGVALLTAGVHRLDLRFVARDGSTRLDLKWLPPGEKAFVGFPQASLILPAGH